MDACTKNWVIQQRVEGKSHQEIADKIGMTNATVSRALADTKTRQIIDYCQREIAEKAYKQSTENVVNAIEYVAKAEELPEENRDKLKQEMGYRFSEKTLQSIGILPSQSQSVFFQQVSNQQNNITISPVISRVLDSALGDTKVIDHEPDEL